MVRWEVRSYCPGKVYTISWGTQSASANNQTAKMLELKEDTGSLGEGCHGANKRFPPHSGNRYFFHAEPETDAFPRPLLPLAARFRETFA
jgi:hypothetical protein